MPRVRSKRAMNDPSLVRDLEKAKEKEKSLVKAPCRPKVSSEDASRALVKTAPKEIVPVQKAKLKVRKFRNDKARGRYEKLISC